MALQHTNLPMMRTVLHMKLAYVRVFNAVTCSRAAMLLWQYST